HGRRGCGIIGRGGGRRVVAGARGGSGRGGPGAGRGQRLSTADPPGRPRRSGGGGGGRTYQPFIDWLKCLGMALIVYGHVAAWAPLATLPPINSKQLGVAFFLFSIGYSLTIETRDRWRVVFNRLFDVYLFGLALALLLSVSTYMTIGRLQL